MRKWLTHEGCQRMQGRLPAWGRCLRGSHLRMDDNASGLTIRYRIPYTWARLCWEWHNRIYVPIAHEQWQHAWVAAQCGTIGWQRASVHCRMRTHADDTPHEGRCRSMSGPDTTQARADNTLRGPTLTRRGADTSCIEGNNARGWHTRTGGPDRVRGMTPRPDPRKIMIATRVRGPTRVWGLSTRTRPDVTHVMCVSSTQRDGADTAYESTRASRAGWRANAFSRRRTVKWRCRGLTITVRVDTPRTQWADANAYKKWPQSARDDYTCASADTPAWGPRFSECPDNAC
jgi:hypothetical protein